MVFNNRIIIQWLNINLNGGEATLVISFSNTDYQGCVYIRYNAGIGYAEGNGYWYPKSNSSITFNNGSGARPGTSVILIGF